MPDADFERSLQSSGGAVHGCRAAWPGIMAGSTARVPSGCSTAPRRSADLGRHFGAPALRARGPVPDRRGMGARRAEDILMRRTKHGAAPNRDRDPGLHELARDRGSRSRAAFRLTATAVGGMTGTAFTMFDTAIGSCGIAWAQRARRRRRPAAQRAVRPRPAPASPVAFRAPRMPRRRPRSPRPSTR